MGVVLVVVVVLVLILTPELEPKVERDGDWDSLVVVENPGAWRDLL